MGSFAFQQESIRAIVHHFETKDRALCADEAGMGKTFIARGVIEQLAEKHTRELLDDPKEGQTRKDKIASWWRYFCDRNYGSNVTPNIKRQRQPMVCSFVRTVTQNRNWDFTKNGKQRELLENALNFADADTEFYVRFLREIPRLLVIKTNNGIHMKEWDFQVPSPLTEIIRPFRVLYICCNLAVAEQNAKKLVSIPQVHMNRADVLSDRLSVLWDAMDRGATPYLEIYPITSTVSTADTPGKGEEFKILKGLEEKPEECKNCQRDCKKINCIHKRLLQGAGEECSLKKLQDGLDLVVYDEFQNFGDIITMLSKDDDKRDELLDMLKKKQESIETPKNEKELLKSRIQSLERIRRIVGILYSDGARAKTLFLSATPFHDLEDTAFEQYRRIGFEELITVLGGDVQEFGRIKKGDIITMQDFLYKSGVFRNERRQLLAGNEQRTVKEYELCCSPTGLLGQAVLLQRGQVTRSAILTTPNFSNYMGLYTNEAKKDGVDFEFAWPHGRYEKLREIVSAGDAEHLDRKMENSIDRLLWIPPCRPTTPLGGVFAEYKDFSKTLVFSRLRATPLSLADHLAADFPAKDITFAGDKDVLVDNVKEEFFAPVFGAGKDAEKLAATFVERLLATGGAAFPGTAAAEDILQYCRDGCLLDVLREFKVVCGQDTGEATDRLTAYFKIKNQSIVRVMSILEEEGGKALAPSHMQKVFNTPFWPFVAISTTVGAEGLDFHSYCNRLVHYTIPPNVIALEQMNGRIDRMDSLAVRRWWSAPERSWDVFSQGRLMEKTGGLSPHWDYGNDMLHYYYLYTDGTDEKKKLEKLKQDQRNYRAAMGAFSDDVSNVINLSPFMRMKK